MGSPYSRAVKYDMTLSSQMSKARSRHIFLNRSWRQAIYLLSYCEPAVQASLVQQLRQNVLTAWFGTRFSPAVDGLAHIVDGGRFSPAGVAPSGNGRRFLGWALGEHWYFAQSEQATRTAEQRTGPPAS